MLARNHAYTNTPPNKLNFIFSLRFRLTHLCTVDIKVVYSARPLQVTPDIISFAHSGANDKLSGPQMDLITGELVCSSVADLHKWKSMNRKRRGLIASGYKISISIPSMLTCTFLPAVCCSIANVQLLLVKKPYLTVCFIIPHWKKCFMKM